MNFNGRVANSVASTRSVDALRELEVRHLIEGDDALEDVLKHFGYKLSLVQSNKNAIMTIMNDLLWEIMTVMWDQNYLVAKSQLIRERSSVEQTASDSGGNWSEKQLGQSIRRVRELEQQLVELETLREKRAAMRDAEIQVSNASARKLERTISRSEPAIIEAESEQANEELDGVRLSYEARIKELENENDLLRTTSLRVKGEDVPSPTSLRIALTQNRGEMDMTGAGSSGLSEADTRGTSSQDSRLEVLRAEEIALMKAREAADEERIDSMLSEIVEKDEIIRVLSEELREVSKGVKNIRRGTAPISRRNSPIDVTVPGSVSKTVIAALEEKRGELIELNTNNERLRMMLEVSETERAALKNRIESLESHTVRKLSVRSVGTPTDENNPISERALSSVRHNAMDSPAQTVPTSIVLSTRKSVTVEIESCELDYTHIRELEEEREKTRKAVEETKTVKFCLNELERQLAALQFQLRQAGVKQEHIKSALAKSGLTSLMRASRAAVFERLYRDAMDRITRMEKIRKEVHEIQARQFIKKFASGVSVNLYDGAIRDHPSTAPHHTHILGGGYLIDNLNSHIGRKVT